MLEQIRSWLVVGFRLSVKAYPVPLFQEDRNRTSVAAQAVSLCRTMMDSFGTSVLLLIVGVVAGTLNVLAGGGSLLSLPVLIFIGLPSVEANGTNRVAILMQNVVATLRFQQHGVVPWGIAGWAAIPAVFGSLLGAQLALLMDDSQFQRILAWIMVAVTVWSMVQNRRQRRSKGGHSTRASALADPPTLVDPAGPVDPTVPVDPAVPVDRAESAAEQGSGRSSSRWLLAAGFFCVGAYGGFVQAGVGFLILAALSMAGLDLVRGNAVKVVAVLCFTVIALIVFARNGQVQWALGAVLGVGNSIGALLGVRLTVLKGHVWIERFVTVTVLAFAVALWVRS